MKARIWQRRSESREKIAALKQLAHQNTEPDFHLVHPGRMLGSVIEHHLMGRVMQKGRAAFHRLQDAALASSRPTSPEPSPRAQLPSTPAIPIDGYSDCPASDATWWR